MTVLSCRELCIGHDGRPVASGISFSIERGEYVAVVGENGSGKSTLISTILGIIPAISGEVSFCEGGRCGIGYLPQMHDSQRDFPALVEEVILSGTLGSSRRLFASREDRARAKEAMGKLGISGLARRSFSELSGGQRQKALLARALCSADDLLVLDEPVPGLDPASAEDMYETVRMLKEETGLAVLAVTHDIPAGLRDATHVLCLGDDPFFGGIDGFLKREEVVMRGSGR